jgi:hypothetical protein
MLRSAKYVAVLAAAVCTFGVLPAQGATDPGDIAYWQSVQNSKNPQEYRAYLGAFPHGAFAGLAQERIKELSGNYNVATAPAQRPTAPVGGAVVGKGTITIDPATPQVGDQIKLSFVKFPHLTGYEMVVVVPAGTPDNGPQPGDALFYRYLSDNETAGPMSCGPFAPGNYEVRWMTRLYNNKQQYQVGARTAFAVAN